MDVGSYVNEHNNIELENNLYSRKSANRVLQRFVNFWAVAEIAAKFYAFRSDYLGRKTSKTN